jgi:hypothetical protein
VSLVKDLLNRHEASTHQKLLKAAGEHGAAVYPKIRLADVLPVEHSGIDDVLFQFALQAHFDFVVAEGVTPVFAVEFDGPTHLDQGQKARDRKKFALCQLFEFPLLRITARYLPTVYRGYDLLSWCVEQWFLSRAFDAAQARGDIPPDESFDPMMIVAGSGRPHPFPMWLSVEPRSAIRRLAENGHCRDAVPSLWIGVAEDRSYRGIMWLRLGESRWAITESSARAQLFPVDPPQLLGEIMAFELLQRVETSQKQRRFGVDERVLRKSLERYATKYKMVMACSLGGAGAV